jgi:hypothetical protein
LALTTLTLATLTLTTLELHLFPLFLYCRGPYGIQPRLTRHILNMRSLYDLDAKALVVYIIASEVAVGVKLISVMTADELELIPLAHDGSGVVLD